MAVNPVRLTGLTRRDLFARLLVVLVAGAVAVLSAVPDLNRFVVVLGAFTVAAAVVAAALPGRLIGTVTVTAATLTALLAGTLDVSAVRPAQAVAVAALLVALVGALGACEDGGGRPPYAAVVVARHWSSRAVPVLLALVSGAVVAVAAAQDVGASFPLVLAGLAAAVVALLVAAGTHRS